MPNYKGRRPGTRRIVIWSQGKPLEWIIEATKTEGDKFEARKRLELEARAGARRTVPRFSKLCEEYALHAEQHLKASTWKVRVFQLANLIEFFGDKPADAISVPMVDSYKAHRRQCLATRGPNAKKKMFVEPGTVNAELRVLRTIFSWAETAGYPMPKVKWKRLPIRGEGRARAFTREELERIYSAARRVNSPSLIPLVVFMVNTGCRRGEAIEAQWEWVDLEAGLIRIPSNKYWQPKSGKPRDVPISDVVRAILSGPRQHPTHLFPSIRGVPLRRFPKELWGVVMEAAGLTGGPHQLRHTFASHFLASVPDLPLLGKIMGHSTQKVTELYAHLLPGHLERGRNAVNLGPQTMAVTMAAEKEAELPRLKRRYSAKTRP
jgi:integrase